MFLQAEAAAYGIDYDGPTVEYTDNSVTVPETNFPLNTEQLQILSQAINPLRESDNFGIDLFLETKEMVLQMLE